MGHRGDYVERGTGGRGEGSGRGPWSREGLTGKELSEQEQERTGDEEVADTEERLHPGSSHPLDAIVHPPSSRTFFQGLVFSRKILEALAFCRCFCCLLEGSGL